MVKISSEKLNYDEIIKNIASNLRESFKSILSKAKFDKTFKAKVIENVKDNKYKVLYKGQEYTATSEADLTENQIVKVCAPQNNWNELFVINIQSITSDITNIKREKMPQGIDTKTFSSLTELWQHYEQNSDAGAQQYFNRFKIEGSWSPVTGWMRAWISAQNRVGNGQWDIAGSIIAVTGNNNDIYIVRVSGGINGYSDLKATWTKLTGTTI